jgi:Ca2+/Na+ antiporter
MIELIFYGRKLSHMYLLQIAIFVVLFVYKKDDLTMGQGIVIALMVILAICNFITVRFLLNNVTRKRLCITVFFAMCQEILLMVLTILGAILGTVDNYVGPAIALFIQCCSVFVLKAFYKKLVKEKAQNKEIQTRLSQTPNDITYAHNGSGKFQNNFDFVVLTREEVNLDLECGFQNENENAQETSQEKGGIEMIELPVVTSGWFIVC